ncbi:TetR family transcriptional regulator (plasmid) [Rhizorhabdus wittichii]|uniref:TetR family transcriptional regulator n=1 Tax=Rhizorhabdus wittichii TaxID=160791 RepID=A0A975DA56_9SPHN|nr:TetR family transcriptional regulator [Rhizorhabdus wittichii]QTH25001.1 TetR family transcriptional regulator [Rhizorhabdus wittichii]
MAGKASTSARTDKIPAKDDALSEERIVSVARHLMETIGLEQVTMRRVAAELDVTAMALYHHVSDKQALIALVADGVMNVVPEQDYDGTPWYEILRRGFLTVHHEIARYPGLGLYISNTNALYPSGFRLMKKTIRLLMDAGFDEHEAIEVNYLLLTYQGGYFLMEQIGQRTADTRQDRKEVVIRPDIQTRGGMNSYDAFVRGLDVIITGFRAQLAAKQVMIR